MGNLHADVLQIVFARVADLDGHVAVAALAHDGLQGRAHAGAIGGAGFRDARGQAGLLDLLRVGVACHHHVGVVRHHVGGQDADFVVAQGRARVRFGIVHEVLRRAHADHQTAGVAAFRAQVDQPVRRADHVQIVFDDQQRVARGQQLAERPHQPRDVVEVQAGGGLVEQEQAALLGDLGGGNAAARSFGQVAGKLEPLCLAARQRRHGLAQPHVFQAHVGQRRKAGLHVAQALEEVQGFADRHGQDFVDGGALAQVFDAHFQHFRAETLAVAIRAAQVDVGQELHFHVFETRATAGRAAPVAAVEAERARRVGAFARQRRLREQLADGVERAHIAGRVGTGGLADGRLIHHDHVGDLFGAQQAVEGARRFRRLALLLQQSGEQHVLHQRGLARAGHAGHADQAAQRQLDRHILQVVRVDAFQQQARRVGRHRHRTRRFHAQAGAQVVARQRVGRAQLRGRTVEDDVAAAFAGAGADVDDAVGGHHDLRIVLHHHQRVAGVAQAVHDFDHAVHVARVQADGRLVQHEQRVHQRGAQRGGQVDPLHFAARQGAALAVERQVAQAHVAQELEPRPDLGHQQIGRGVQRAGERQRVEEPPHPFDGQQHHVVDRQAVQSIELFTAPGGAGGHEALVAAVFRRQHGVRLVFCAQAPEQRIGLQARAVAGGAGRVAAVLGQQHAHVHLVGLGFQPVKEALHSVPLVFPGVVAALPVGRAMEHPALVLFAHVLPGHAQRHARARRVLLQFVLAFLVGRRGPRLDGAFQQGLVLVGDDQAEVDADHAAKAPARFAGAQRRIEREAAGQRVGVFDVAVGAVQAVAVFPDVRVAAFGVHHVDRDVAGSHAQRRVQRFHDAFAFGAGEAEAVLDHVQDAARFSGGLRCLALLGALGRGGPCRGGGAGRGRFLGMHSGVALLLQKAAHFLFGEIGGHGDGEGHHQARIAGHGGAFGQRVVDGIGRVAAHHLAAAAAIQARAAREQQFQVVVQLGHRANRAARAAHRVGLVDGDGRQDAFDAVHLRLVHAVQELARIGREGFHIAPLPLGVQGVEGQRTFAGPGHPGDDDQFAGGDGQVQVLEIVLAGANDADLGAHGRYRSLREEACRRGDPSLVPSASIWNN
ncbi:hypothetical protein D3C85_553730 [compost metagenome]